MTRFLQAQHEFREVFFRATADEMRELSVSILEFRQVCFGEALLLRIDGEKRLLFRRSSFPCLGVEKLPSRSLIEPVSLPLLARRRWCPDGP